MIVNCTINITHYEFPKFINNTKSYVLYSETKQELKDKVIDIFEQEVISLGLDFDEFIKECVSETSNSFYNVSMIEISSSIDESTFLSSEPVDHIFSYDDIKKAVMCIGYALEYHENNEFSLNRYVILYDHKEKDCENVWYRCEESDEDRNKTEEVIKYLSEGDIVRWKYGRSDKKYVILKDLYQHKYTYDTFGFPYVVDIVDIDTIWTDNPFIAEAHISELSVIGNANDRFNINQLFEDYM